jgi:fibro-slime domain-containing protein
MGVGCGVLAALSGCGDSAAQSSSGAHAGSGGARDFGNPSAGTSSHGSDAGPAHHAPPAPAMLDGLTQTEIGGYKLGPALKGALDAGVDTQSNASGCSVMTAVVRDFRGSNETGGHPDFESFDGKAPTTGLVAMQLGSDDKPVYASHCEAMPDRSLCPDGQMTTSEQAFGQWYRTTPGVNDAYVVYLMFEANDGVYTFQSDDFFPLDGSSTATLPGKGNGKMKYQHDFGFTTELHAAFLYQGGERFSFTGDDDLWVFVNGKLAIDLGGLHPPASDTLDLDASAEQLGLEKSETYPLDLFHAERHTNASNFRVDTTLGFTACGEITPEVF